MVIFKAHNARVPSQVRLARLRDTSHHQQEVPNGIQVVFRLSVCYGVRDGGVKSPRALTVPCNYSRAQRLVIDRLFRDEGAERAILPVSLEKIW